MDLFDHLDALEDALHARPFGLITDVDGVLAEIAPTAESARVDPACRRFLAELVQRLELVAVVSGRSLEVVRDLVGVPGLVYVGNHGLEFWRNGRVELHPGAEAYRDSTARLMARFAPILAPRGVTLEDKTVGIVFHYTQSQDPPAARNAVLHAIEQEAAARPFHLVETRRVVELRPPLDATKGTAVTALARQYGLRGVLYMGDDFPDVDAFRAVRKLANEERVKGLAILVDNPEVTAEVRSQADYTLSGVPEVARLLQWITQTLPAPQRPSAQP